MACAAVITRSVAYTNPLPSIRRRHEGAVPITFTTRAPAALMSGEAVTALPGGPVVGDECMAAPSDGWCRSVPGGHHTTATTTSAASSAAQRAVAIKSSSYAGGVVR